MIGLVAMTKKELQEIMYSKKSIIFMLFAAMYPVILLTIFQEPDLPIEICVKYLPLLVCYFSAFQFTFPSMGDEIKGKTLEVLLTLRISKLEIILGKILAPSIISSVIAIISALALQLSSVYLEVLKGVTIIDFKSIILYVTISYFAGIVVLVVSLLFPDTKNAGFISTACTFASFIGLYKLYPMYNSNFTIFILIVILILIVLTVIATTILNKRTDLITKI